MSAGLGPRWCGTGLIELLVCIAKRRSRQEDQTVLDRPNGYARWAHQAGDGGLGDGGNAKRCGSGT